MATMSKDEETATPPPTNPFCMGEWVLLQPEGYSTYDFTGRPSTSTCCVRRSEIIAVDKVYAPNGRVVVQIAIPGQVFPRVMFDPSPEGKRDANLLVEACIRKPAAANVIGLDKRTVAALCNMIDGTDPNSHSPFVHAELMLLREKAEGAWMIEAVIYR
jgi:hypothetical protein